MRFLRRPRPSSRCIAVFCGAFHPPTVAHLELARAARERVDDVMWVMPRRFPHKTYEGVDLARRLRLLLEATDDPVALSDENLFFSVAQETSVALPGSAVQLLIGEDGARRVIEWDYGFSPQEHADYLSQHLASFPILTARRQEIWQLPETLEPWFQWLDVEPRVASVSSTEVRDSIREGRDWKHLVPSHIHHLVERYYGSAGTVSGQ